MDPHFDSKGLMDPDSDFVGPPVAVNTTLIGNPTLVVAPEPSSISADKEDNNLQVPPSSRSSNFNFELPSPAAFDQLSDGSVDSSQPTSLASSVPGILSKANADIPRQVISSKSKSA